MEPSHLHGQATEKKKIVSHHRSSTFMHGRNLRQRERKQRERKLCSTTATPCCTWNHRQVAGKNASSNALHHSTPNAHAQRERHLHQQLEIAAPHHRPCRNHHARNEQCLSPEKHLHFRHLLKPWHRETKNFTCVQPPRCTIFVHETSEQSRRLHH